MQRVRAEPIRVVVVDDTPTVRELLVAILQSAGGIQVVGVGSNGRDAIRLTKRLRPHVVTMDVVMPQMDGLEATRHIMREVATPIVIVTGGLMRAEEDLTFEALRAGALTVVRTPGLADPEGCEKVVQTVRLMAGVPVVHHWGNGGRRSRSSLVTKPPPPPIDVKVQDGVQMIGIAASTGGPSALARVLRRLPTDFPVPILVVQHITRGFITGLAEWLSGETRLRVGVANHGDVPQPGAVLLAPDDYHLQVSARGDVELCKEPPYKGLRPSANFLFRSLAQTYGPRAMGVVLTGMGDDGIEGLQILHQAGGLTMAQNEESCVVYGMPREAVMQGVVVRVLTPDQIAVTLEHIVSKEHPVRVAAEKRGGR
jgi:two-component system chemotaxis response regulator CheB